MKVSKKQMRNAIDKMCKSCIYDSRGKGTWRKQVEDCTSKNCPLFAFRPTPYSPYSGQDIVASSSDFSKRGTEKC